MKTPGYGIFLFAAMLLSGSLSVQAQLLDHLRALAETRYPVGDPSVIITNTYGALFDGPKDIAVADLDGDGNRDIAASDKDGSVTIFYGSGDATFGSALYLRTWTNAPRDAAGFSITNYFTNSCT